MVGFGVMAGVGKMPTSGVVRVYFPKWQLPRANGLNATVPGRQRTKFTYLGETEFYLVWLKRRQSEGANPLAEY